jgi:CheY-like chemotaxis protein
MKSIYIIDDDQDIVDAMTIVLKSAGYRVGFQNDEQNLVENIVSFKPDLIILDVIFPENNTAGFEMSRLIKANEKTKHVPILMLSAVNEKGRAGFTFSNRDRDEAFLPVEEFVEKPIRPDELLTKVVAMTKSAH